MSNFYFRSRRNLELKPSERITSLATPDLVRLSVQAANLGDAGVYTLVARNAAGHAATTVDLQVDPSDPGAPAFIRRLSDIAVKVGTRTRFLVELRSDTQIKVSFE